MTISQVSGQAQGTQALSGTTSISKGFPSSIGSGTTANNRIIIGGFTYQDAGGAGPHTWVIGDCTQVVGGTAVLGPITLDKLVGPFNYSVGNYIMGAVWSAPIVTPGSCTMQIAGLNSDGNSFPCIGINEYASTAGPITVSGINNSATGTTSSGNSGSVTAATILAGQSVLIGVACDSNDANSNPDTFTPGNSFSSIFSASSVSGQTGLVAQRIVAAGTNTSFAFTTVSSPNHWAALIAAYQELGAGGGSPLRRNSSLSGLGSSGPFFHDPLAARRAAREERMHAMQRSRSGLYVPGRMAA